MDNYVFGILHSLTTVPVVGDLSLFLSYPLVFILFVFIFFWVLFFTEKTMYSFSIVTLTGFIAWLSARILKELFVVSRPFIGNESIIPLYKETGFSFPSEHATVFMALSIVMLFLNKKIGMVVLFLTILIGLSRIIIGVHYPSDVLGGFMLGSFVALFFIHVFKKI